MCNYPKVDDQQKFKDLNESGGSQNYEISYSVKINELFFINFYYSK